MQGNFQAFTISYIVENFLSETRCKREKFKLLPRLRIFSGFRRPSVAKTAGPAENYPIRGLFPRLFFARAKLNFILRRAALSRFKRQAAALSLPFGGKREGEPLKNRPISGRLSSRLSRAACANTKIFSARAEYTLWADKIHTPKIL